MTSDGPGMALSFRSSLRRGPAPKGCPVDGQQEAAAGPHLARTPGKRRGVVPVRSGPWNLAEPLALLRDLIRSGVDHGPDPPAGRCRGKNSRRDLEVRKGWKGQP